MTYRTDDEREELISFMEWLSEHGWVTEPHAKRMWLVGEYMKERQVKREWGKKE